MSIAEALGAVGVQRVVVTPPALHPSQRLVWEHPARYKVLACGRRWGKTRLAALMCVHTAIEGGLAWWIAPTYPMASIGWKLIKGLAKQFPGAVISESNREVTFPSRGTVAAKSADKPDRLRGEGLDLAVFEEAAVMVEATWGEVIRPALADKKGKAVFIFTPKGRNWSWRLFRLGQDGDHADPEWVSWQLPTRDNPFIDPAEIEAARANMSELLFAQEFEAQFLEDAIAVFRNVVEQATATWQDQGQLGHRYIVGVDWGKLNDFTVFAVVDLMTSECCYLERFNRIDYTLQVHSLYAVYERFRPECIIAEANSIGIPIIESLWRMGLPVVPFTTTLASKQLLVDALRMVLERRILRIIPDQQLINELQSFEPTRTPSGMISYSAPEGEFDDCVMALGLAIQGALTPQGDTTVLANSDDDMVQISPY